jgi:amino acid transporter
MRYNDRNDYDDYYDDYYEYEDYEEPQPYFLSTRDLIFYCLAFMTPAATTLIYSKAQTAAHGALAGSYIVALILVFLTLLSYRRLSRAFHEGGSVFSYTGHGIHRRAGLFTGWTALLFYLTLASSVFMIGADTASKMFSPVPYIFWLILIAVVSGVIVLFGQRLSSLAVTVITLGVVGMTAIYILVCFMSAGKGAAPAESTIGTAFTGTEASLGNVMSGAAIACLSFLGFDSVTTLTDETEHAKRSTGKAMAIACACAGVLFFFQALSSAVIIPDFAQLEPSGAMAIIADKTGGSPMQALLSLSVILASFGVGIAGITAASRMLGIMLDEARIGGGRGRGNHSADGSLLDDLFPQTGTSPLNVIICFAVAVLIAFVIPGKNSLLAFDLARFAGILCFMLVNAASLIFFWFKKNDQAYVRSLIIPAAGFLASLWIWINIDPDSFGIGIIFALVGVIIIAASYLYERLVFGPEPAGEFDDRIDERNT